MKTLDEIHKFLSENLKMSEKEIKDFDDSTVKIAKEIALFAHRKQYRENGEEYVVHPLKCLENYGRFLKIVPNEYLSVDKKRLEKIGIPFDGVQEVCVLHDVLEDTDLSIDDVAGVYAELGHKDFFDVFVREPLLLITRDNNTPYADYINIVLTNPVSAMAKMMDMVDNVNLLGLAVLDDKKLARSKRYLDYIKVINDKYHFIEKAAEFKNF